MSAVAVRWALRDAQVRELVTKPAEVAVLVAVAHHADPKSHGNAYPSVRTLMAETRLSESAVRRALRHLRRVGVIEPTGLSEKGTTIYQVSVGGVSGTGGSVDGVGATRTPKETVEEKNPLELPPLVAVVKGSSGGFAIAVVENDGRSQRVCTRCGEVLVDNATSCPCEVFGT